MVADVFIACDSLLQASKVGSEVVQVAATSKDINENAEITYKIIGGNRYNHFRINETTGVIAVNASLDFEKYREYVLAVRAQDGGEPPLASQCLVNITVLDFNDNPPVFSSAKFAVAVSEDATAGYSVIQVHKFQNYVVNMFQMFRSRQLASWVSSP